MLVPFGTLGAFISMRDPMPDRKALFDVGAAGPLVGFLVTLPVIVLGAFLIAGAVHNLIISGDAWPRSTRPQLKRRLSAVADAIAPRS